MAWQIDAILALIVLLPTLPALFIGSRAWENRSAKVGTAAVAASFILSVSVFAVSVLEPPQRDAVLHIDRLSGIMLILVTGISAIVHAFAVRYMDSDLRYARFFRWLGLVTAAVVVVVLANDLIALAAGWIGISLALYALQTHYRERPAGMKAAAIMRNTHIAGDVAMIAACILLGAASGATRMDAVLSLAGTFSPIVTSIVVALLAVAAFSKSAQIPLHRWLPETMEAPTPVSALMHAGIVNSGGFLFARFSPLVVHAQATAIAIFVVGAVTALWGSTCMLVRTDVKRALAYSTMGQMGYMTLQCGLGAFPAAIFHLFAHGIFKATLFLGSGYSIHERKRELRAPAATIGSERRPWVGAVVAILVVPVGVAVAQSPLGQALPPYGWVLLAFATLTCMQTTFAIVKRGGAGELITAIALVLVVLPAYAGLIGWFDRFLRPDIEATTLLVPPFLATATVVVFAIALIAGWGIVRVPRSLRDRVYVLLLTEKLPVGFAR